MGEIKENICRWSENLREQGICGWNNLPDIPLYMDQVIGVLAGQLEPLKREEDDRILTSTMINNYVKNGVVTHPVHKKYTREQVAAISVVAALKSVLSMQDLKTLLSDCPDMGVLYESFCESRQSAFGEAGRLLEDATESGGNLKLLALRLSVEAMARQAAAARILQEISAEGRQKQAKIKKKSITIG